MKEKIKRILLQEPDPFIRFEVLEKFFGFVYVEEDVHFLLSLLRSDRDPCVRHEVAAQLFRIEEKKPHLMVNIRPNVIEGLLDRAEYDESTVVRHEAIEALGYIGDERVLEKLREFSSDQNIDIRSTAEIAVNTATRRFRDNVGTGQLGDHLVRQWEDCTLLKSELPSAAPHAPPTQLKKEKRK